MNFTSSDTNVTLTDFERAERERIAPSLNKDSNATRTNLRYNLRRKNPALYRFGFPNPKCTRKKANLPKLKIKPPLKIKKKFGNFANQ